MKGRAQKNIAGTDAALKLYNETLEEPKFSRYYQPSDDQKTGEMMYVGGGMLAMAYSAKKYFVECMMNDVERIVLEKPSSLHIKCGKRNKDDGDLDPTTLNEPGANGDDYDRDETVYTSPINFTSVSRIEPDDEVAPLLGERGEDRREAFQIIQSKFYEFDPLRSPFTADLDAEGRVWVRLTSRSDNKAHLRIDADGVDQIGQASTLDKEYLSGLTPKSCSRRTMS